MSRGEHDHLRRARPRGTSRRRPRSSTSCACEAFERFGSLPVPSQETEEWRYTDLSNFELDFTAVTDGGAVREPQRRAAELLAAAGDASDRAGLLIQHNSDRDRPTSIPRSPPRALIFDSIDAAAADHPDLVEPYLHSSCRPIERSSRRCTPRSGPGARSSTCRATRRSSCPLQTLTYLDADGAAIFPHTLLIVEAGSEVTFIDRYASPDLRRAFSDAITEIHVGDGAHVRYVSIQEWGSGVTHLGIQRATRRTRRHAPHAEHRVRRLPRARRSRDRARRAGRLLRDARGLLRR